MTTSATSSILPGRPRRPRRSRLRPIASVALVVAVAASASACGDDDAPEARSSVTSSPAVAQDGSHVHHDVVKVRAVDFSFQDLPKSIRAGTRLTLTNGATTELHELVAFRLPDAEKRPVADLVRLPEAELGPILGAAQPATVLMAPPGGTQIDAVGDGTISEPGRYLIMCSIPTGADPAAYLAAAAASKDGPPDVPGGPPHFVNGMYAELLVT